MGPNGATPGSWHAGVLGGGLTVVTSADASGATYRLPSAPWEDPSPPERRVALCVVPTATTTAADTSATVAGGAIEADADADSLRLPAASLAIPIPLEDALPLPLVGPEVVEGLLRLHAGRTVIHGVKRQWIRDARARLSTVVQSVRRAGHAEAFLWARAKAQYIEKQAADQAAAHAAAEAAAGAAGGAGSGTSVPGKGGSAKKGPGDDGKKAALAPAPTGSAGAGKKAASAGKGATTDAPSEGAPASAEAMAQAAVAEFDEQLNALVAVVQRALKAAGHQTGAATGSGHGLGLASIAVMQAQGRAQ